MKKPPNLSYNYIVQQVVQKFNKKIKNFVQHTWQTENKVIICVQQVEQEVLILKNRVKEYRLKEGLTQEELSAKSEVSRSTISGLENGSLEVITNVTMQRIANALNRKIATIFFKD